LNQSQNNYGLISNATFKFARMHKKSLSNETIDYYSKLLN